MSLTPGMVADRRVAVALTFDFDAESPWICGVGPDRPAAISRGSNGAFEGVPRILRFPERQGLPATSFVPGDTCDRHPAVVREIVAAGHAIEHLNNLHEAPRLLPPEEERTAIDRGLEALQRVAGVTPRGLRSPSWELSGAAFGFLTEFGFEYDVSQLGRDRPYGVEDRGTRTDIVEVPSAWELCDSAYFLFSSAPTYLVGLCASSKVEEIWRGDFDEGYAEGGDACYILTMHPQIIGRPHRMQSLERIVAHVQGHDGVWFAQMHEIAADFRRREAERDVE